MRADPRAFEVAGADDVGGRIRIGQQHRAVAGSGKRRREVDFDDATIALVVLRAEDAESGA